MPASEEDKNSIRKAISWLKGTDVKPEVIVSKTNATPEDLSVFEKVFSIFLELHKLMRPQEL